VARLEIENKRDDERYAREVTTYDWTRKIAELREARAKQTHVWEGEAAKRAAKGFETEEGRLERDAKLREARDAREAGRYGKEPTAEEARKARERQAEKENLDIADQRSKAGWDTRTRKYEEDKRAYEKSARTDVALLNRMRQHEVDLSEFDYKARKEDRARLLETQPSKDEIKEIRAMDLAARKFRQRQLQHEEDVRKEDRDYHIKTRPTVAEANEAKKRVIRMGEFDEDEAGFKKRLNEFNEKIRPEQWKKNLKALEQAETLREQDITKGKAQEKLTNLQVRLETQNVEDMLDPEYRKLVKQRDRLQLETEIKNLGPERAGELAVDRKIQRFKNLSAIQHQLEGARTKELQVWADAYLSDNSLRILQIQADVQTRKIDIAEGKRQLDEIYDAAVENAKAMAERTKSAPNAIKQRFEEMMDLGTSIFGSTSVPPVTPTPTGTSTVTPSGIPGKRIR